MIIGYKAPYQLEYYYLWLTILLIRFCMALFRWEKSWIFCRLRLLTLVR